jgi:hypothetical protein
LATVAVLLQLLPGGLLAGGGPEKVLLVVNGDSPLSMQIANFYMNERDIPPEHVLWLHDIPYPKTISIDTFRNRIWQPIRDFITQHQLDNEIDIIAYSASFPYAINFSADLKANKLPKLKYHGNIASLTGLTYFARHVESGSPYYLAGNANRYFRRNTATHKHLPRAVTEEETRLQKKAQKAFRNRDYLAAFADYEALVQGFPEHGGLWHELARTHAALGNHAEAIIALSQAGDYGWSNSTETRNDPHLGLLSDNPAWPGLLARMERRNGPFQAAHGFSSSYEWTGATQPVKTLSSDSLNSHYLSTMLAFTGVGGNSVPEVKNYLSAAHSSDGTSPDGTVYLMVNNDVRSRTRQPLFQETVAELERRGRRAEILVRGKDKQNGKVPKDKDDVIGAVVGSANFNWKTSGSRLLPGAIAESLTSYGGILNSKGGQTKLTEFLRQGAAGSSGTVAEPYSIQAKFPVPLMHVYYADGCSLAEAFYQSVEAPYQLLIVGDPLARPFARFSTVKLDSPDPRTPWYGVVTLKPSLQPAPERPVAHLELWVDGQLLAYALPDEPFAWDTRSMDDGHHELRLVAQEAGPVETRSYSRFDITLANTEHRMTVNTYEPRIRLDEPVIISGTARRGRQAELWQGNRQLASASVKDGHWQLQVPAQRVGIGRVTLGVRVLFDDKALLRSPPVKLTVAPPAFRTPAKAPGAASRQEPSIKLDGKLDGVADTGHLDMTGELAVDESGFFELVVIGSGEISLAVDEQPLLEKQPIERKQARFFPLSLAAGRHHLQVGFTPEENRRPYLKIMLQGDQVASMAEVSLVEGTDSKVNAGL